MSRRVKYLVILVIWIISVFFLTMIFRTIDYNMVKSDNAPLFSIKRGVYLDGGSVEWFGIGYKIFRINKISGFQSVKIGGWNSKIGDFIEEEEAYKQSSDYLHMTLILNNDKYCILNSTSSLATKIMDIVNNAEFEKGQDKNKEKSEEVIEEFESEQNIGISIRTNEKFEGYTLKSKDGEIYLIRYDGEKYKLKDENLREEIMSEIEGYMKKQNRIYGEVYEIRSRVIVIAIIIVVILVTLLILEKIRVATDR